MASTRPYSPNTVGGGPFRPTHLPRPRGWDRASPAESPRTGAGVVPIERKPTPYKGIDPWVARIPRSRLARAANLRTFGAPTMRWVVWGMGCSYQGPVRQGFVGSAASEESPRHRQEGGPGRGWVSGSGPPRGGHSRALLEPITFAGVRRPPEAGGRPSETPRILPLLRGAAPQPSRLQPPRRIGIAGPSGNGRPSVRPRRALPRGQLGARVVQHGCGG